MQQVLSGGDRELLYHLEADTPGLRLTCFSQSQCLKILSQHLLQHYKHHHHPPPRQNQRCSGNRSFLKHSQLSDWNWKTCCGLLLACTAKKEWPRRTSTYSEGERQGMAPDLRWDIFFFVKKLLLLFLLAFKKCIENIHSKKNTTMDKMTGTCSKIIQKEVSR